MGAGLDEPEIQASSGELERARVSSVDELHGRWTAVAPLLPPRARSKLGARLDLATWLRDALLREATAAAAAGLEQRWGSAEEGEEALAVRIDEALALLSSLGEVRSLEHLRASWANLEGEVRARSLVLAECIRDGLHPRSPPSPPPEVPVTAPAPSTAPSSAAAQVVVVVVEAEGAQGMKEVAQMEEAAQMEGKLKAEETVEETVKEAEETVEEAEEAVTTAEAARTVEAAEAAAANEAANVNVNVNALADEAANDARGDRRRGDRDLRVHQRVAEQQRAQQQVAALAQRQDLLGVFFLLLFPRGDDEFEALDVEREQPERQPGKHR
jgi:hypothetical protein